MRTTLICRQTMKKFNKKTGRVMLSDIEGLTLDEVTAKTETMEKDGWFCYGPETWHYVATKTVEAIYGKQQ